MTDSKVPSEEGGVTTEIKLKPCPFCGNDDANLGTTRYAHGSDFEKLNGFTVLYFVSCAYCGGNSSNITGGNKTEIEAIQKWNEAHCWKLLATARAEGRQEVLGSEEIKTLIRTLLTQNSQHVHACFDSKKDYDHGIHNSHKCSVIEKQEALAAFNKRWKI